MNKTNHFSVFFTAEKSMFDLSAQFERLTTKDVIQSELDTFFTWEFLTNENILRILEKHECDIDDIVWYLAKENENSKNFIIEKIITSKLALRKG